MGCNASQEQRVANDNNESRNTVDDSITESGFHDDDDGDSRGGGGGDYKEKQDLTILKDDIIDKKENLLEEFDEEADLAAKKIQAAYRGHKVRNTIKAEAPNKNSNNLSSNNVNDISSSIIKKSEIKSNKKGIDKGTEEEEQKKQKEFKNEQKQYQELQKQQQYQQQQQNDDDLIDLNLNDKELQDAAIKIQTTFRGHLQRKLQNNNDSLTNKSKSSLMKGHHENNIIVDIDKIRKDVAEELNIDLNDPELNKAAAKIQASFRGYKIRKDITT